MKEGIYYKRGAKSDFASVDMLPNGEDIPRIVLASVDFHETLKINGRTENEAWTATFAPNPFETKPMVLNSTNRRRIAKMYWHTPVEDGTECAGRINLLANIPVRLTKEEARDVANGGTTWGLRISKQGPASEDEMQKWLVSHGYAAPAPTPKPKKVVPEDKIEETAAWARTKGKTIEDLESQFEMSQPVRDAIADLLSRQDDTADDLPE